MQRRALLRAALAAGLAGLAPACGSKDATATEDDVCTKVSFSSSGSVGFSMPCSTINSDISNIKYDQFSRRTSYSFNVRCASGGTSFVGSVQNIQWDNLGRALGADVTVNGKVCHF